MCAIFNVLQHVSCNQQLLLLTGSSAIHGLQDALIVRNSADAYGCHYTLLSLQLVCKMLSSSKTADVCCKAAPFIWPREHHLA